MCTHQCDLCHYCNGQSYGRDTQPVHCLWSAAHPLPPKINQG
ncbi:Uncharacterised protein [Vibrio cholerae]|nr:Uncharacterised protein [Vibrio cholerae]